MSDIEHSPRSEEADRAAVLRACCILDTPPEDAFDDIAHLAARICDTPIALVSLLDGDRQWFKSKVGLDRAETPVAVSFCVHAVQQPGLFVVPDATRDARFRDSSLVCGEPHIRFYAGAVLETAAGVRLGTLCVLDTYPRADGLTAQQANALQALARQVVAQLELRQIGAKRVEETRHLQLLNRVGCALSGELDLERVVQTVTDAGTELTGAEFGAFFYNVVNEAGESYMLYTLSGVPREAFAGFPMPRNTAIFRQTFTGVGAVRSADITKSSLYGRSAPHYGMPKEHLPVRSYLAVPVISHSGKVLGGLFFGHPEEGVFSHSHEETVVAIAAYAAVAIDNASLFQEAQREIERRRVAEGALRESEARLRDLLATLDLGTLLARDIGGIIRFWSEGCERLFGWTAAEAVGRNAHALLRSEFPVSQAEMEAALERDGEWIGDLRQRARDGREMVVAVHKMLRRDAEGQPMAVLECLTDRTAQRRTEMALRASEARLQEVQADLLHVSRISAAGEMASALAHELNQPLTAVTAAVRAAQRMLADSPGDTAVFAEIREAMDLAAEQALRAGQIIRRLRDFVATDGEGDKQLEDVAKLAEEAAALALVGAQERGIRVDFRFDTPLPPVIVDRIQIQQVLLNLVRNALDAMTQDDDGVRHSRELVLTATLAEPDMVEVAVADTGPGIAPELAGRLFSAFVSTKPGGMGIGLSICRSIIEAHGGRLWAEPKSRGTVFRFTLPTAVPEAAFK